MLATAARPQSTEQILDYRRILDRKDIDAVVIAKTQHWHGIPFILACQAKKPIYVEKPQRPPLQESRRDRAIRPVGQGLVESFNYSNAGKRTGRFPDSDPPRGYHWNEYLGPAPLVPFNRARLANSWWFDYSGGMLTNWAIHHIDIILWA